MASIAKSYRLSNLAHRGVGLPQQGLGLADPCVSDVVRKGDAHNSEKLFSNVPTGITESPGVILQGGNGCNKVDLPSNLPDNMQPLVGNIGILRVAAGLKFGQKSLHKVPGCIHSIPVKIGDDPGHQGAKKRGVLHHPCQQRKGMPGFALLI